jgi:hypothetical protein
MLEDGVDPNLISSSALVEKGPEGSQFCGTEVTVKCCGTVVTVA